MMLVGIAGVCSLVGLVAVRKQQSTGHLLAEALEEEPKLFFFVALNDAHRHVCCAAAVHTQSPQLTTGHLEMLACLGVRDRVASPDPAQVRFVALNAVVMAPLKCSCPVLRICLKIPAEKTA